MNIEFNQVLREVFEILKHAEKSIIKKIPVEFIIFLKENMDKQYKVEINFYDKNWIENLREETQAVLSGIYIEYICSEEEKNQLLKEEMEQEIIRQKELMEKYAVFKDKDKKNNFEIQKKEIDGNTKMIEINNYPWYKKILNYLKRIFDK